MTATVFSYNGMDEEDDDNDTINGFGASLAYAYTQGDTGFNAGIAWVSNIGDSSTLTDVINDNGFDSVKDEGAGHQPQCGRQLQELLAHCRIHCGHGQLCSG